MDLDTSLFLAVGLHVVAEPLDEVGEVTQFFRVGQVVYAVHEGLRPLPASRFADVGGHGAVGQQHELLDEFVGIFRLLEVHAQGFALFVQLEAHLRPFEGDGPVGKAALAQLLGQAVQGEHFVAQVALAGFDYLLRLLVGEAAVAANDGAGDVVGVHFGFVVQLEQHRVGEFVLVGAQRADAVREVLGQHGDGAVHQVHRSGAAVGLFLDDAAGAHVVGHVGNVHAHLPQAVVQTADGERVVEVFRVARVDGHGGHAAQVDAPGHLVGRDARVYLGGFGFHVGGVG